MDRQKRGSAYIMVVFASFPILLAALTALAVSINSRNISARHSDYFGMYELASAASVFMMLIFEEAYIANRQAAHRKALIHFEEMLDGYYGERVNLPADYVNQFRHHLLPIIWAHFERSFNQQGNVLTRQFSINLGTEHVFYGTMRITRASDRIYFWSSVTKNSGNIPIMRETVQGSIRWPAPAARWVYLCETNAIKNLDFFTPWVVELKKL